MGLQAKGKAAGVESAARRLGERRAIPERWSVGGASCSDAEEEGVTWDEHVPEPALPSTKSERDSKHKDGSDFLFEGDFEVSPIEWA